jgi:hypothetical protein
MPSRNGTAPHPIARLAAAATLLLFLVAQPSTVCLPLCLLGVHYQVAAAPAHQHTHANPCHTDLVRVELPAAHSLGTMLPTQWVPSMPSIRVVAFETESPESFHLRPLPATDPPPPRSV